MELRYYQKDAVNACYRFLAERDDNPCIVIPTGGGKTPVIATIARDVVMRWQGRILILAHVKELLEQAAEKLVAMEPKLMSSIGIYSAGLNRRDTDEKIIIGGIQSVYKRACDLGRFDLIITDEAHLIPPEGEGMYRSFLADMKIINPQVRLIGLTATPYRMTTGMVCAPENLLNEICYEVGIRELITQGFLSPLISKAARGEVDTDGLHIRGGEFIQQEVESLMTAENIVNTAVHETVQATADRKSVLIFCAGVNHANEVLRNLRERGCEAEGVFGDTLPGFREKYLADFKAGRLKYLVNVGVLTTGFDAPNVDCVVLLRPTKSPGLYYQMCGRGFRIADNKPNCLILDFGGNIERHGPLDAIDPGERMRKRAKGEEPGEPPTRKCPECLTVMPAQYSSCPTCGYVFPVAPPHDAHSGTAGILTGQIDYETVPVQETHYAVHVKRGADPDAPRTMRVDYCIDLTRIESEWVCPEHTGYAREKFVKWWERMAAPGTPIPETAWDAVTLANEGVLAEVKAIRIRHISGERFSRIVDYELGNPGTFVPEPGWNDEATPAGTVSREELDAIPF